MEAAAKAEALPIPRERVKPGEELLPITSGRGLEQLMAGMIEEEKERRPPAERAGAVLIRKAKEGGWELTDFGEGMAERIFLQLLDRNLEGEGYETGVLGLKRLREEVVSLRNFALNLQSEAETVQLNTILQKLETPDVAGEKIKLGLLYEGYDRLLDSIEQRYLANHLLKKRDDEKVVLTTKRDSSRWWLYKELAQVSKAEAERGIYPTFYDAFEANLANLEGYNEVLEKEVNQDKRSLWKRFVEKSLEDGAARFYAQRKLTQFEFESEHSAFASLNQALTKKEGVPSQVLGYQEAGSIAKWRNGIVKEAIGVLEKKGEKGWWSRSDILRALMEAEHTFIPQGEISEDQLPKEGESRAKYIARLYGGEDPSRRESIVAETLKNLVGEEGLREAFPEQIKKVLTEFESESGSKVLRSLKEVLRSKWFSYGLNWVRFSTAFFPTVAPIVATMQATGISPREILSGFSGSMRRLTKEGPERLGEVVDNLEDLLKPTAALAAGPPGDPEAEFTLASWVDLEKHPSKEPGFAPQAFLPGERKVPEVKAIPEISRPQREPTIKEEVAELRRRGLERRKLEPPRAPEVVEVAEAKPSWEERMKERGWKIIDVSQLPPYLQKALEEDQFEIRKEEGKIIVAPLTYRNLCFTSAAASAIGLVSPESLPEDYEDFVKSFDPHKVWDLKPETDLEPGETMKIYGTQVKKLSFEGINQPWELAAEIERRLHNGEALAIAVNGYVIREGKQINVAHTGSPLAVFKNEKGEPCLVMTEGSEGWAALDMVNYREEIGAQNVGTNLIILPINEGLLKYLQRNVYVFSKG